MTQRKRLLFLSAHFPLPVTSGTQARVLGLLQRLARRFELTFLSLAAIPPSPAELEALRSYGVRVLPVWADNKRSAAHRAGFKSLFWFRRLARAESSDRFYAMMPSMARAIRQELQQPYDVLFLSYWFWSSWVYASPAYKVVDANDVQSERTARELEGSRHPLERLLRQHLLARYAHSEAAALSRADLVIATTERDRETFMRLTGSTMKHLVVPTGVDTEHFTPRRGAADVRQVVFYGALGSPLNVDAVQHLVTNILPRLRRRLPGVRLTLVGSSPGPALQCLAAADPTIVLTGTVDDVRGPLSRAGVVVLPLRYAQGIRGRVFELLSMGLPVVATPVAVAGMGLESGNGILLAEDPEAFTAAVVEVLENAELRRELGERGRALAVSRYSLAATYDPLVALLEARVEARHSRP